VQLPPAVLVPSSLNILFSNARTEEGDITSHCGPKIYAHINTCKCPPPSLLKVCQVHLLLIETLNYNTTSVESTEQLLVCTSFTKFYQNLWSNSGDKEHEDRQTHHPL
jgi:hypothetical protein